MENFIHKGEAIADKVIGRIDDVTSETTETLLYAPSIFAARKLVCSLVLASTQESLFRWLQRIITAQTKIDCIEYAFRAPIYCIKKNMELFEADVVAQALWLPLIETAAYDGSLAFASTADSVFLERLKAVYKSSSSFLDSIFDAESLA